MTRLILAGAVLGLSVASAAAECNWQHSAQAKTDPTVTASVAEPAKMSTPADAAQQVPAMPVPQDEK